MNIARKHADYEKMSDQWRFMRHSIEGEEAMKEYADEHRYILIPEAMRGWEGEHQAPWQAWRSSVEGSNYIDRARYPEIVARSLEIAEGKAFSRDPLVEADTEILEVVDDLFATGETFKTLVLDTLDEGLATRMGGLFVNLDEETGDAKIHIYMAEAVLNWKVRGGKLRWVVLQDDEDSDDAHEEEPIEQRLLLGLDDQGEYYMEKWRPYEGAGALGKTQSSKTTKGTRSKKAAEREAEPEETVDADGHTIIMDGWKRYGPRVYPTARLKAMRGIPFYPICGWKKKPPPFKALAKAAQAYFRASAEYNHAMWWAATPQPYITFGENGHFWGVDEFAPETPEDEAAAGQTNIEIRWGATTPILLKDGDIKFAAAPTASLSQHEKRLEALRKEMAGLGARAFSNVAAGNVTAETERMQQSGEGAVVKLIMGEVDKAITLAVRAACEWRGIAGYADYSFRFNPAINFEAFDMRAVPGLLQLRSEGVIGTAEVRRHIRQHDVIAPDKTDEELDEEIAAEGLVQGFDHGFGDGDGDDGGDPPPDDPANAPPDGEGDEET